MVGLVNRILPVPSTLVPVADFTAYGFKSTAGTSNRTDPDRWSDCHNVKEFGATGGGVIDDTAAIQACIDSISNLITSALGTVYFPPGTYKITSPIRLPLHGVATNAGLTINLIGDGDASHLIGNFQGFIIDHYDPIYQGFFSNIIVIEKLKITNQSTTLWSGAVTGVGCIRLATTQFTAVRNCTITGLLGIVYNTNDLYAWRSRLASGVHDPLDLSYLHAISGTLSITINGTVFSGTVNFSASASYAAAAAQMQTALTDGAGNNLFEQVSFDDGALTGQTVFVIMSSIPISPSSIAYATGTAATALKLTSGTASQILQSQGGICSQPANADGTGTGANRFATCMAFPCEVMDCSFHPVAGSITSGSIAIATGNQIVISNCVISGYDIGIGSIGPGICLLGGTVSGCNYGFKGQDQFGDIAGPGMVLQGTQFINNSVVSVNGVGGIVATGVKVIGNGGQYGIYIAGGGATSHSIYNSCVASGSFAVAAIAIDDAPAQHVEGTEYNTFIGCNASNSGPGDPWLMPLNAPTAQFFNSNNPAPEFTWTTLPINTGDSPVIVGDEYLVKDSPTAASGNFAASVTVGGGSNHVKVRWDGSNWRIV